MNGLVRGYSGIRVEFVEALVRLFNAGFVPVVPQQGPSARVATSRPSRTWPRPTWGTSRRGSGASAGEAPVVLRAKEGLALINGTEIMKAIGCVLWQRATNLSKAAAAIAALSLESLFGSVRPFADRLADLKNSEGQLARGRRQGEDRCRVRRRHPRTLGPCLRTS